MSDDDILADEVELADPSPPQGAPVKGEVWANARSGIPVEVRAVRFAEDMWQVDVQTHGATVRMGYSLSDFLLLHERPPADAGGA